MIEIREHIRGNIGHGDHDESVWVDPDEVIGLDRDLPRAGGYGWVTVMHLRNGDRVQSRACIETVRRRLEERDPLPPCEICAQQAAWRREHAS